MQANREEAKIAISNSLLKFGTVVFRKNGNFPKRLKKTDPIQCHNTFFIKQEFVI